MEKKPLFNNPLKLSGKLFAVRKLNIKHLKIKNIKFKKTLPFIYIISLILALVMTFVYGFVHSFTTCSSFFGTKFCTPTGIFLALVVSLPGYIIAGNALSFIDEIPWATSFAVVVATSAAFYFLLGSLIDNFKARKMNSENITRLIVIIFFTALLVLFVGLL